MLANTCPPSYGCIRAAIDTLEGEDRVLRTGLSLPERVHVEEPPPPEIDATSEKTGWSGVTDSGVTASPAREKLSSTNKRVIRISD